jgi:hypothetical protein
MTYNKEFLIFEAIIQLRFNERRSAEGRKWQHSHNNN